MTKIFRFLGWPYPKKKLLLQVFVLIARIRICLWLIPSKTLKGYISTPELPRGDQASNWDTVNELVDYVRFCSRFVPYATCLTQALATRSMLRRMGQNCMLKIGVDKDQDHKLLAHAWIEVDGKIIIGKVRDIRRYSILSHNKEQLV
jgi:Transglutaminase-like superfamily